MNSEGNGGVGSGDKSEEIKAPVTKEDFIRDDLHFVGADFLDKYKTYTNALEAKDSARNLANRVFATTEEEAYQTIMSEAEQDLTRKLGHVPSQSEMEAISKTDLDNIRNRLMEAGTIKGRAAEFGSPDDSDKPTPEKAGQPIKPLTEADKKVVDDKFKTRFKDSYEKYLTVHGVLDKDGDLLPYADLDGKCVLGLFKQAELEFDERRDVNYVMPGEFEEGRHNSDTGNQEGVIGTYQIDKDNGFEWDTTSYNDHHDSLLSDTHSSATKNQYEALVRAGLLERSEVLDKLVEFVTQVDNKSFPEREKYFANSYKMMLGLSKYVKFDKLHKFFKDGHSPTEELSEEKLREYGLLAGATTQKNIVEESLKYLPIIVGEGFHFESEKFGKVLVDVGKRLLAGDDAANYGGFDTYIVWTPEKKCFFISTKKGFPEDFSLPDGEKKRNMWVTKKNRTEPLNTTLQEIIDKMSGPDLKPEQKFAEYLEDEKTGKAVEPEVLSEDLDLLDLEEEWDDDFFDYEDETVDWENEEESTEAIEKSFDPGSVWVMSIDPKPGDPRIYAYKQAEGEEHPTKISFHITERKTEYEIVSSFDGNPDHPDEIKVEFEIKGKKIYLEFQARDFINALRPKEITEIESDEKRQEIKEKYKEWIEEKLEDSKEVVEELSKVESEENENPSFHVILENIKKSFEIGGEWVIGEGDEEKETLKVDLGDQNGLLGGSLPGELELLPNQTYKVVKTFGEDGLAKDEIGLAPEKNSDDKVYVLPASQILDKLRPKWILDYTEKSRGYIKRKYELWLSLKLKKVDKKEDKVLPVSSEIEKEQEDKGMKIATEEQVDQQREEKPEEAELPIAKVESEPEVAEEEPGPIDPINSDEDVIGLETKKDDVPKIEVPVLLNPAIPDAELDDENPVAEQLNSKQKRSKNIERKRAEKKDQEEEFELPIKHKSKKDKTAKTLEPSEDDSVEDVPETVSLDAENERFKDGKLKIENEILQDIEDDGKQVMKKEVLSLEPGVKRSWKGAFDEVVLTVKEIQEVSPIDETYEIKFEEYEKPVVRNYQKWCLFFSKSKEIK